MSPQRRVALIDNRNANSNHMKQSELNNMINYLHCQIADASFSGLLWTNSVCALRTRFTTLACNERDCNAVLGPNKHSISRPKSLVYAEDTLIVYQTPIVLSCVLRPADVQAVVLQTVSWVQRTTSRFHSIADTLKQSLLKKS
jgi:hypothetical protein